MGQCCEGELRFQCWEQQGRLPGGGRLGASLRHSWKGRCFKLVGKHKNSSGERKSSKHPWEAGSLGLAKVKAGDTAGL